ncbi:MAG: hypothetical protein M3P18_20830 [Actinomycetota bacterium]|nr:hypothetical protein [Actinomycetota bacterium]
MSDASASAFAFAQFLHTRLDEPPHRKERELETVDQLFSLGRLAESRLLAVHGAATGSFPPDSVSEWLPASADLLAQRSAELEDEVNGQVSRLPSLDDPLRLWEALAGQAQEGWQPDVVRSLMLRAQLDQSPGLALFQRSLLFLSDDQWNGMLGQAVEELGAEDAFQRLSSTSWRFLDGAFDAINMCGDVLAWSVGEQMGLFNDISSGTWGGVGFDVRSEVRRGLMQASPPSLRAWVEQLLVGEVPRQDAKQAARTLIRSVLRAKLLSWADAGLASADPVVGRVSQWAFIEMPAAGDGPASLYLGPQSSWASLLWRLAPTDSRSVQRREAVMAIVKLALSRAGITIEVSERAPDGSAWFES